MNFKFKVFKWIGILISIFILIYISISSYYIYLGNQGENILIPKGYIGDIIISYEDKLGLYEKENGNMIYRIPESGIYRTKFSEYNKAYMYLNNVHFYYIDELQNKEEIFYLFEYDEIDTTFF